MTELTVTISGPPDSGKRIVAGLIEDALRVAKITVRFEDEARNHQKRPSVSELQAALLRYGPVVTLIERTGAPVFPVAPPVPEIVDGRPKPQPFVPEPNPYSNPFIGLRNMLARKPWRKDRS